MTVNTISITVIQENITVSITGIIRVRDEEYIGAEDLIDTELLPLYFSNLFKWHSYLLVEPVTPEIESEISSKTTRILRRTTIGDCDIA